MRTGSSALILLHYYEGCSLSAYPDPATGGEPITIGWGTCKPGLTLGTTISQAQADQMLVDRLAREFEPGVTAAITSGATQKQFDALVCFAYNVGLPALRKSTLMKLHNSGNKKGVANEFMRWTRGNGKIMKGLQRRRAAERALYMGIDSMTAIAAAEKLFP